MAWSRLIRDVRAALDLDRDLFGQPWAGLDLTLAKTTIRPITAMTAAALILPYEWLGTMPIGIQACYGLFFQGVLGGAVVYATDPTENLGVWARYGFQDKLWYLARGACAHWTPTGSASRLIRQSMRQLPPAIEVITALVDADAGEIGTVYQAAGFHYLGVLGNGRHEARIGTQGGVISERQLRREGADSTKKRVALPYVDPRLVLLRGPSRARYLAFRGSVSTRKRHLRAIAHKIRPYPKRSLESER